MTVSEEIRKWLVSSGVLTRVGKPSRYIGKELNAVLKDPAGKLRVLLAFPDAYEVGMSHLGFKILYRELNSRDSIFAERTYLPWKDMIEEMRKSSVPLFSLETYSPALEFDIVGITLQYELGYTNVLALLELAGIPLFQRDRTYEPIVLGGGPCASNPEPMSDFFDAFVIGDGEEAIIEVCGLIEKNIDLLKSGKRRELLETISEVRGVYVPSIERKNIVKAAVADISDYKIDGKPVVPFMKVIHDRAIVEVMRGCNRGCRFCQAGIFYRPVRERGKEEIVEGVREILKGTGYDEVSLLSLSTMDHSQIGELTDSLLPLMEPRRIALSLPSSRVDAFDVEIASRIASIRKTGLTFAPEAGTQRLRNVINKNVTEEDLLSCAMIARKKGWQRLKLYFMIGLPTETSEDIEGIVKLSRRVKAIGFKELTISVAVFIPKPHTPFQFSRQIDENEASQKAEFLKGFSGRGIDIKIHNPSSGPVEGILSRGDRKVGRAVYEAYRLGAMFDEWDDQFDRRIWDEAFKIASIDTEYYFKGYSTDETLPWEHVSLGVSKEFLVSEYFRSLKGQTTPDCRWTGCAGCSVCGRLGITNVLRKV